MRAKSIDKCIDIKALSLVLFFLMEKSLPREDDNFKFSISSSWSNDIIEFLKVTRLALPLDLYKVSN